MARVIHLPPLNLTDKESNPIVIGSDVIDARTGKKLRKIDWQMEFNPAPMPCPVRSEPGIYCVDWPFMRFADGRTGKIVRDEHPLVRSMDVKDRTLVYQDKGGKEIWSRTMTASTWTVRPPQVAVTSDRIITIHDQGLVGLDRTTGDTVWIAADGPNDGMHATDTLVLATNCGSGKISDRSVVAWNTKDGSESFRVPLPDELDPEPIGQIADLFYLTESGFRSFTVVFDSKGKELLRLNESLIVAETAGDDVLLLTSRRLLRYSRAGNVIWETDVLKDMVDFVGSGQIHLLDNGDVLAMGYSPLSDSGEQLVRVSAQGKVLWSTGCGGIGIWGHSAYRHYAYFEVRGKWGYVVGQASHGDTVTIVSLDTGKEDRRWIYHCGEE